MRPALLAFPLLLLACQRPESAPPKVMEAGRVSLELGLDPGVEQQEALGAEIQEAVAQEMAAPGADRYRGATLKVRVIKYRARPAANRFLTLGIPGLATGGAGWAVLASRGAPGADNFFTAVVGGGLVGTGAVYLILGIIIGGHQAHMDHQRGYALQQFKAKATLEWMADKERGRWKQTFTSPDLSDAAPLSPEAAKDPAQVRKEMAKALARRIRQDLDEQFR